MARSRAVQEFGTFKGGQGLPFSGKQMGVSNMRTFVRKIGLAAAVGLGVAGAALGMAVPAQAQHWHGHGGGYYGGGFGPGFVGGLAVGAAVGGPYYGYYGGPYAYAGDCYLQRRVFHDRWGHRFVRSVRVCG